MEHAAGPRGRRGSERCDNARTVSFHVIRSGIRHWAGGHRVRWRVDDALVDAVSGTVAGVLDAAVALARGADAERLVRLRDRLPRRRLRLVVAGEAKRGKSTLANALLGRQVLPTGVLPLTSTAVTVTAAEGSQPERMVVSFVGGGRRVVPLEGLAQFVTEAGNPGNVLGVAGVELSMHCPLLETYSVDLVDTPGTGSVYEHNTGAAMAAVVTLDAAVLVLTADPPLSAAEAALLRQVSERSVRTFVVLNKSDRLTPVDLAETVRFTEDMCARVTGGPVEVLPCSASAGQADPGFRAFVGRLGDYLGRSGERDVDRALRGHTARVLSAMAGQARLEVAASAAVADGRSATLAELSARLATLSDRRDTVLDRCGGALDRLRRGLDRSAAGDVRRISRRCRAVLDQAWEPDLAQVNVSSLHQAARDLMIAQLTDEVDAWRADAISSLERGLRTVAEQAEIDVSAQVQLASDAVQDALDIDLLDSGEPVTLVEDKNFRYDFTEPVGWAMPLQGASDRFRSSAARRRRIRTAVTGEVNSLTDRQIGRARAGLQLQLQDAGRRLRSAVEQRYADTIDRFATALDDARTSDPATHRNKADGIGGDRSARLRILEELIRTLDTDLDPDVVRHAAQGG